MPCSRRVALTGRGMNEREVAVLFSNKGKLGVAHGNTNVPEGAQTVAGYERGAGGVDVVILQEVASGTYSPQRLYVIALVARALESGQDPERILTRAVVAAYARGWSRALANNASISASRSGEF